MKKYYFAAALLLASWTALSAQDIPERLDSVVVSASRAGEDTPVTFTTVGRAALRSASPVNSLPMTLSLQPSVVTWNEGGTGLGNSSLSVRGIKGSQINVTLNGVTLNDAESQEVFWVNIPALQSLISGVQLQRGLGTTSSGTGAFGASVNMNTAFVPDEPGGSFDLSGGSFGTLLGTVSATTGLTAKGLYASVVWSEGTTDGYIDHGYVRSRSGLVTLGWLGRSNSLRLTWLMGQQSSGITWDGIDLETFEENPRYNASDYNFDHYFQNHFQLNYTHSFSPRFIWSNTFNYTHGYGFDEYIKSKKLSYVLYDGNQYPGKHNINYRKLMMNDLYVLNSEFKYTSGEMKMIAGVSMSRHWGDHYGKVLGVEGLDIPWDRHSWYDNSSLKYDASVFWRAEYQLFTGITGYLDLHLRNMKLDVSGKDDDGADMAYAKNWTFFNPRGGLTWRYSPSGKVYASVALGHREPGRSDIKENVKGTLSPIKPESMVDIEAGWSMEKDRLSLGANIYMMEYKDMLLETGRLSSSGYAIKENVPRGWRRGVELTGAWKPARWILMEGNTTLSVNKIKDYTSYVAVDDATIPGETVAFNYGKTDMLLSPSVIGMVKVTLQPWDKGPSLAVSFKHVGSQYLDNTSRDIMKIPAWNLLDCTLEQKFAVRGIPFTLSLYGGNLLNRKYYASGWRYEGYEKASDTYYYGIGVYPQAPVHAFLRLSTAF